MARGSAEEPDEFFEAPHMISHASFHRGGDAEGLMDLAEVVDT